MYAVSWRRRGAVDAAVHVECCHRRAAIHERAVVGIDAEVLPGAVDHAHAVDGGIEVDAERVPAPAPTGTGVTPSAPTKVPVVPIGAATPVVAEIEYSCTVPAASLKPRP